MSQLKKEWFEKYGVKTSLEFMQINEQLAIVPSTNLVLTQDTTDIALIRSQCSAQIKNSSWTLVYAKDEASFDEGWKQLKEKLSGLGWDELVQFDKDKYQVIVDARNAVTK
jgi:multiple sugar transport system substrate-binding protein/putative aldouronate transport system substrate-binding protein